MAADSLFDGMSASSAPSGRLPIRSLPSAASVTHRRVELTPGGCPSLPAQKAALPPLPPQSQAQRCQGLVSGLGDKIRAARKKEDMRALVLLRNMRARLVAEASRDGVLVATAVPGDP